MFSAKEYRARYYLLRDLAKLFDEAGEGDYRSKDLVVLFNKWAARAEKLSNEQAKIEEIISGAAHLLKNGQ